MQSLTAEGRALVEQVAQRHNVSPDAVLTLLQALDRGGGSQAQFSHPDLGGMGQWSRGGMIMVGDMFNSGLKARVDQLCNELSDELGMHRLFAPPAPGGSSLFESGSSFAGSSFAGSSWPASLGTPSSSGSQNDMRYAYFPDTRRLAVQRNGVTSVYDTGDHRIGGASQQQSGSQDLTFTSQYGTVWLHELPLVSDDAPSAPYAPPAYASPAPSPAYVAPSIHDLPYPRASDSMSVEDDVFAKIERLHALQQKGILSDAEFAEKKKELLARI